MSFSPVQKQILKILRAGGVAIFHRKPDNQECFRIIDKDKNPLKNVSVRTIKRLENRQRVVKQGNQYIYNAIRKIKHTEIFDFICSYDGQTWYRVSDYTLGKAKYKFWKEVKTKKDPTIPYSKIRGKKKS